MAASDDTNPKFLHRKWSGLGEFYSSFGSPVDGFQRCLDALGKLTLSIECSYLNDQLFAHTSHANLMICQSRNTYPPKNGVEFLVVAPRNDGTLKFSINRWGAGEGKWSHVVEPEELLCQFNSVLWKLGWISYDIDE